MARSVTRTRPRGPRARSGGGVSPLPTPASACWIAAWRLAPVGWPPSSTTPGSFSGSQEKPTLGVVAMGAFGVSACRRPMISSADPSMSPLAQAS